MNPKEIILTQGQVALVDADVYEVVKFFRWYARWDKAMRGFNAERNILNKDGTRQTVYLHRLVTNAPKGMVVDHINHNTLDCRRENLRVCTHAENMLNRRVYKNNTTGFKGVTLKKDKKTNQYASRIRVGNKTIFLGHFVDAISAAKAYNEAALKLHGAFANPNYV